MRIALGNVRDANGEPARTWISGNGADGSHKTVVSTGFNNDGSGADGDGDVVAVEEGQKAPPR
jgi:hypothetical protein